jgi:hypothetical protein
MKKFELVLILVVLAILTGCTKSSNSTTTPPVTPTVVGLWTGYYANTVTPGTHVPFAFLLRADGTAREYYNSTDTSMASYTFDGTYTSTDSVRIVSAHGNPIYERHYSGKMNTETTAMTGTFGWHISTDLGTFSLTK